MSNFQKIIIPFSIIIAGALIAFSIYMVAKNPSTPSSGSSAQVANGVVNPVVQPLSDADHIRGNKDAKVIIFDYSDLECPFCKQYHANLEKIFSEYGPTNQVAWVYRQFPLDIHPKARKEAEASECANEIGGNDAFWKFVDTIFSITPSNNDLDPQKLYDTADQIGLDKTAFQTCLSSGKYTAKIEDQYQAALKAGGLGTPYTVMYVNGEYIPLVDAQGNGLGALSYDSLKSIIDGFLKTQ